MLTNTLVIVVALLNIMSKFIRAYETLVLGKFLAGIYCGLFSGILPIYLNEISPPRLRGLIGTVNSLTSVIGILVGSILGLDKIFGTDSLWPVLAGFILLPAIVNFSLLAFHESPKYLFINRYVIQINIFDGQT